MDKYKIDSHKLMYHVQRVSDWMQGATVYPIYMEVSPAGSCNHRCVYCGLDFMEYQPRYLDTDVFKERLDELGRLGLKSIMYAGEGEPFLHRNMADIIAHTNKAGIDVAVTTNAVLLEKEIAHRILGKTQWIKASVNGATPGTYAKIHRCNPADFDRVIENMSNAAKIRSDNGYTCTLGMQLVLLPQNCTEVVALAELARDIGMDYLVVKPYSQHPQSKTTEYSSIGYADYEYLADELSGFQSDDFEVIFRINTMRKWDGPQRNYSRCLALPFWSYIDAGGSVWGCSVYLGDEKFCYGNIYEQSFQDIWQGQKRKQSLCWVQSELDASDCRVNCRMDEVNRYLWDLKNTPAHVNFI
ncbi:MAG: radical SAM protein [Planctomycetota bacterium]|jgi:MoaA/NifB/PqqE/SkfB family radical SAM enzyme